MKKKKNLEIKNKLLVNIFQYMLEIEFIIVSGGARILV